MKKIVVVLTILFAAVCGFAQVDRTKAPQPQPNPEIKIAIPDALTLPNGMKVIVVENHKLPKVSFQLFIDYPIAAEGDKAGLSAIFGELLACGTTSMSKDAFDQKIDYIGASLNTSSRGFFASSLKKHTPQLLTLLSDLIMHPAFPQEDFDRIKSQNLTNLASIATDADAISGIVGGVVNYGTTHPYGEVTNETTINNITLDDIKTYYSTYFTPNYAYLVIVGDVTQDEAKGYVDTYFASWQKGNDLKKPVYSLPQTKGNNVYFVDKPGAVQSVIDITHTVNLKPGHPDEIALSVLNGILGGGSFSARLMANLREDKAYTYGCYSSIYSDEMVGGFSAGGSFRNEVTDSAIVQILFEIDRISKNMVTDEELTLVKSSMTGAFARSLERPETVARFALNTIRYNLPKDYYSSYLKNLEKVTKEDLLRVAGLYLQPNHLNIVVVGNQEIAEKLKVFDASNAVHYKDYFGNDKAQLKAVPSGVTLQTILDNYMFGAFMVSDKAAFEAKLAKVGLIQTSYVADVPEMGGKLLMTTYEGKPNKSATLMKVSSPDMNAVVQKEWFNGTAGGTFAMGAGSTKYEGDELAAKMKPSFPFSQYYYLTDESLNVELLGIDVVDGKEYYKVKVAEKDNKDEFSYEFYSVETGMLEKKETFTKGEGEEVVSVLVTFGDYKDMGKGFYLPHTMLINTQGQALNFVVSEIIIKKKAKSKAFEGTF
ncbi:MAG: insulinase family protein [Bacteroidetes bacterium]|nr:insulinase family protein [Bacteroidota bacterium]